MLLNIPQPKVSALKNYRLDQFSVERLMEFLAEFNQQRIHALVSQGKLSPQALAEEDRPPEFRTFP